LKRRKNRGVYFFNRPAPTERTWLLEHGATEDDLAFPDPKGDPLGGLFPDMALRERFLPLVRRLGEVGSRALLFDEARGVLFRAFIGVGPPDRQGDHPEGLLLVRRPEGRGHLPGLTDDAPGARDLVAFFRGCLGGLCGGNDLVGLALPGEVLAWSKARRHDLNQIDFLPEHRTRNLRLFWDSSDGTEILFDAVGRVYSYSTGNDRLAFRYDSPMRFLEEAALRIAAGGGAELPPSALESVAPGHPLPLILKLRSENPASADPAVLRESLKRLDSLGIPREHVPDLQIALSAREGRWEDTITEMRRTALGTARSLVDRRIYWEWLAGAAKTLARPADFREIALSASAGPLSPEVRGLICDDLLDREDVDGAIKVLERWMRPGQEPDPALASRAERIRQIRMGRWR